jgi:hypothetical protein
MSEAMALAGLCSLQGSISLPHQLLMLPRTPWLVGASLSLPPSSWGLLPASFGFCVSSFLIRTSVTSG